ncbi:MAG TPA: ATP-binding cassette domain-containing protein [Acidimicrobiales bacterium]|nr:ATP-binding cassette domain-containing protein [Acidimicrobiales bacterium]
MTIEVGNVSRAFGGRDALVDVTVVLGGGLTAVIGPNGSGKTTLLRLLATTERADRGSVRVSGHDTSDPSGRLAVRRALGYLTQTESLPLRMTVHQYVEYVAVLKEIEPRAWRLAEVARCIDTVGLGGRMHDRIRNLSGGMRRRVGLAQALLGNPALLILDEPDAALDPETRRLMLADLAERSRNSTVVVSTHHTGDIGRWCDRIVVLSGGRIRFTGPPGHLRDLARGRVWRAAEPDPEAWHCWQDSPTTWRCVGASAPDGVGAEPTLDDGYLTALWSPRATRP